MDTATKTEGVQSRGIWAIRIRLQVTHRARELALFNLAKPELRATR
jgi:hypothetical protein